MQNQEEEPPYSMLKSSKEKSAILYDGYYYNHGRDNNKTTYFKCRQMVLVNQLKKECSGSFILKKTRQII